MQAANEAAFSFRTLCDSSSQTQSIFTNWVHGRLHRYGSISKYLSLAHTFYGTYRVGWNKPPVVRKAWRGSQHLQFTASFLSNSTFCWLTHSRTFVQHCRARWQTFFALGTFVCNKFLEIGMDKDSTAVRLAVFSTELVSVFILIWVLPYQRSQRTSHFSPVM